MIPGESFQSVDMSIVQASCHRLRATAFRAEPVLQDDAILEAEELIEAAGSSDGDVILTTCFFPLF